LESNILIGRLLGELLQGWGPNDGKTWGGRVVVTVCNKKSISLREIRILWEGLVTIKIILMFASFSTARNDVM